MKTLTQEQIQQAAEQYSDNPPNPNAKNFEEVEHAFRDGAQWAISQMQDQWVPVDEIKKLIDFQEKCAVRYKACFQDKSPNGHQVFEVFVAQLRKLLPEPPKQESEVNPCANCGVHWDTEKHNSCSCGAYIVGRVSK